MSELAPRIWVGSLADYNNGRLHGEWLEAARGAPEIEADISAMLERSVIPGAEEFAIFDYENFGPLRLDEYESIETVTTIAQGIAEHGEPFAAWVHVIGQRDQATLGKFEDCYRGEWSSLTAYADELLDELGATQILEEIPNWLQPYMTINSEAFARDLHYSGDLLTAGSSSGGVYIFEVPSGA
jgi:antirestriction protein